MGSFFACAMLVDSFLPPGFILAEALQNSAGPAQFASEWLAPPWDFSHTLADLPVLTLLRLLFLVGVTWTGRDARRPATLAAAYIAFRLSTLGYTVYVACKIGLMDFTLLPSPVLGYFLCTTSLLACWVSAVIPYIQAAEGPLAYRTLDLEPLLAVPRSEAVVGIMPQNNFSWQQEEDCAICLTRLQHGESVARLCANWQHSFHERCLEPWSILGGSCPLCRDSNAMNASDSYGGPPLFPSFRH
ncbi:unnamed protein product [Polarella glacialis]|uniref:RING-type domain-containing protein n=1 Tax=Polarella glacialis TaxID=89957 RepID=A0A813E4K5_POLGL|nr:unnamed protein product [Polarella glacialis]